MAARAGLPRHALWLRHRPRLAPAQLRTHRQNAQPLCRDHLPARPLLRGDAPRPRRDDAGDPPDGGPRPADRSGDTPAIHSFLHRSGLADGTRYALFALRPWKDFDRHIAAFANAAEYAHREYGLTPVLYAMEPCRDRAALNAVAAQLRCPYLLLEAGSNGTEIVALIRRMSLVIAMRLHTLIFAAGQGVPIVGVVYDPKVSGFLDYLGQDLYLPLEEASAASLCDLIDTAMAEQMFEAENIRSLRELAAENEELARSPADGGIIGIKSVGDPAEALHSSFRRVSGFCGKGAISAPLFLRRRLIPRLLRLRQYRFAEAQNAAARLRGGAARLLMKDIMPRARQQDRLHGSPARSIAAPSCLTPLPIAPTGSSAPDSSRIGQRFQLASARFPPVRRMALSSSRNSAAEISGRHSGSAQ